MPEPTDLDPFVGLPDDPPQPSPVHRFARLLTGGRVYHDVTVTVLDGLARVVGWRWRQVRNRHERVDPAWDLEGLTTEDEDPADWPDWPKEIRQTWLDRMLKRPGTEHYVRVIRVRKDVDFVIPVIKIDRAYYR